MVFCACADVLNGVRLSRSVHFLIKRSAFRFDVLFVLVETNKMPIFEQLNFVELKLMSTWFIRSCVLLVQGLDACWYFLFWVLIIGILNPYLFINVV
jgi:hypothetical protein